MDAFFGGNNMKLLIASDIHGSAYWCEKLIEKYKESQADRILLLGDLLYHGPRNDLPKGYDPKKVIALLNEFKDKIYAVKGNCEAEVDQMVLEFPVMAEYALLVVDGITIFATHGHIHNENNRPPLSNGDVLLQGHTHVLKAEKIENGNQMLYHLNPGSVSIPKNGNPNSYAILENKVFSIYDFEDHVLAQIQLLE